MSLEATGQAAGAGDPRPAARDVRAAGQRAARPPDRRAGQDRPLPAHQRPQPGPGLRRPARALPDLGGGPRRAGRARSRRRSGRAASAGRRRRGSRRSSSGSASRPTSTGRRRRPREESLEFLLDLPGVGRKTAACVLIFTWGIPEIPVDVHIHRVGGRLGLFPPKRLVRAGPRRDAGDRRPRGRLRAAHEPDPPRPGGLPPEAPLRRVRAAADVPLVPCRAQMSAERANEQEDLRHLRSAGRLPRGPDPLARLPLATATPAAARRRSRPTSKDGQSPLPDQLRQLPHALRRRHRRQLRAQPRRAAGPGRPARAARRRERRSRRPKDASSTRSKTASTAPPRRAACPPASSTANRPKRSPNSSPTPPARASQPGIAAAAPSRRSASAAAIARTMHGCTRRVRGAAVLRCMHVICHTPT